MAKPTRIKHSAAGIYLHDVQIDRGTSFGCSSALNSEELKEIGNIGIVEIIDGIPTVDITLEANEYGSVKTLCTLANAKFNWGWTQASPHATSGMYVTVCSGDYFIGERRYTLANDTDVDFTALIGALTPGQNQICCLSISTAGALTATGGTAFVDSAYDATTSHPATPAGELRIAEVYLTSGLATITDDWILNVHDVEEVTIEDFEYSKVDVVLPVKEAGDNTTTTDYVTRTAYIENAFCNRLDMTFNTGGVSTNSFGMESDNKRWFLGTKRTVVVDRLARSAGNTYTLSQTPVQLDNNLYTLRCRLYDATSSTPYSFLEEGTAAEVTAHDKDYSVSGTTVTFDAHTNPAAGVLVFRYCADVNEATNFERIPIESTAHPDPPGGLMQGQVEIYLSDDTDNIVLRVQSCTISASLTREALNEIGHQLPYDRPLTLPVPVTVSINTTASDLEEFARLMGKKAEWDAGTLSELNINDFAKDLSLIVKMWREPDTKRDEEPFVWQPYLKKVTLTALSVTDEAFDLRVDGNATQNFSLKCDNLTIEGII